jgi:flagellar biosynthesis protein FlhB
MQPQQNSNWLKAFMDHLRDLLKGPPYLVFFFASTVIIIFNLFRPIHFYTFLAIFLYSIFGVVWRHAVKDIRGRFKELYPNNYLKKEFWFTSAYQIINLIAVGALIFVIVRYCK